MGDQKVIVNDRMQQGYSYARVASMGEGFDPAFQPELTPAQMLKLGVFCGKYMTDCRAEFPDAWFAKAKLAKGKPDCSLALGLRQSAAVIRRPLNAASGVKVISNPNR